MNCVCPRIRTGECVKWLMELYIIGPPKKGHTKAATYFLERLSCEFCNFGVLCTQVVNVECHAQLELIYPSKESHGHCRAYGLAVRNSCHIALLFDHFVLCSPSHIAQWPNKHVTCRVKHIDIESTLLYCKRSLTIWKFFTVSSGMWSQLYY